MLALTLALSLVGINLDDFDQPYSVEMANYLVGEIELNNLQFKAYAQGQEEEYKRVKALKEEAKRVFDAAILERNTASTFLFLDMLDAANRSFYAAMQFLDSASNKNCTFLQALESLKYLLR